MHSAAKNSSLISLLAAVSLAGCESRVAEPVLDTSGTQASSARCGPSGYLKGRVIGAGSTEFDWSATDIVCEGMPRPGGEGARLRFEGPGSEPGQAAAIIIALPELDRGMTDQELGSNVTFVVEGSGRFFSTAGPDICWTDVARHEPLSGDRYAIAGRLYCIGPLAEINGDSSVTIPELDFSGLLDWTAK